MHRHRSGPGGTGRAEGENGVSEDGASIPDEEWERFLRESEAGARDAPQEPSARARMVTRRLLDEKERPDAWRSYRPAPRTRNKAWPVLGLLLVVALAVVAVAPGRVLDWFSGGSGGGAAQPLAEESERPSEPPATDAATELPTLDAPFRGSPAARWSDGAAGIHLPEAQATGWMTKDQVARALDKSLDFLVASSLDPAVLRGARPTAALAMINPQQTDVQDFLATAFRAPDRDHDPLLLFSRFTASRVRPAGDVVKTRGRITFAEGKLGALEVTTDVTYVYPVVRAAAGSEEVARTIVRRETVLSWDDPAKVRITPGTFSLRSYFMDSTNGGCENSTGYFVPSFAAERAATDPGDGPEVDPYDRSTPMGPGTRSGGDATCGRATRT